jgi:hypothetical protein
MQVCVNRPQGGVWKRCVCALASACAMNTCWCAPEPLDDKAMAEVTGQDGIGFAVHLEMTTYAVMLNVGGIIDMYAMTLNLRTRPDGGDYIDIGLPFFLGVSQFGFRALGAQTDPTAPITNNYGSLLLDGHAAMKGHVYMWAQ